MFYYCISFCREKQEVLHCAAPTAVLDYNTSPFSWERPLSLQPLSPYAVAHNEMEHYTASLRISAACKNMIEDAIAAAYQDSCCGIIRNCQVLVFQFLNLLGICQKRFRHLHHPLRCEKGSPRRDSPGCRPREHLQLDHYGKYNARFCICQPENGQQNYVYSP